MSKEQTTDLLKFLEPFEMEIQEIALWLREFVWDLYPESNELIYDNYNAVAFGWSPSDKIGEIFCSIAVGSNKYVHFGFYWGSKINDPKKILLGNGSQYRYIKVKTQLDFPKDDIIKLIADAYQYSLSIMKQDTQTLKGATIVKSISPNKKRPGMIIKKKK
jgi:hypothetical protein